MKTQKLQTTLVLIKRTYTKIHYEVNYKFNAMVLVHQGEICGRRYCQRMGLVMEIIMVSEFVRVSLC